MPSRLRYGTEDSIVVFPVRLEVAQKGDPGARGLGGGVLDLNVGPILQNDLAALSGVGLPDDLCGAGSLQFREGTEGNSEGPPLGLVGEFRPATLKTFRTSFASKARR